MATTREYIDFLSQELRGPSELTFKPMFGEYMGYANGKPILMVCDNTVFVRMRPEVADLLDQAPTGFPYPTAKEHYVLDISDPALVFEVLEVLERVTPVPKPRRRSQRSSS